MGIFPSIEPFDSHKYDNISKFDLEKELKKIILDMLETHPALINEILSEVRRKKIKQIINKNNEVQTVRKRRSRTNLPPSNTSDSTH